MIVVVAVQSLSHFQLFVAPWMQQAWLLCLPLSPRVCSNSCPLSRWCYLTISSSASPFSFCLQSFPASGSFPVSPLFTIGGQVFSLRIGPSGEQSGLIYWHLPTWGGSSFSVVSFCFFTLFMGFLKQKYWSGLPSPSPVDHVLSELFTMTPPSWAALHGVTHSFIELCKPVHYNKVMIQEGEKTVIRGWKDISKAHIWPRTSI